MMPPVRTLIIDVSLFDAILDEGGCPIEELYPEHADCTVVAGHYDGAWMRLYVLDAAPSALDS